MAIAIVVTAVGGLIDAKPLLYGGILLGALVAILWLWFLARPQPVMLSPANAPPEADWEPKDEKDRAILALKLARENGKVAYHNRSNRHAFEAVQEIQAALLTTQPLFGIGQLTLTGEGSNLEYLNIYLHYLDVVYPRLRAGHIDAAKAKAESFRWSRGD